MSTAIEGSFSPGYEPVAAAFEAAFAGRPTMGGALSIRVNGEWAVNLWGGIADERNGAQWTQDTSTVIFSCTKGLVSILAARLFEAGKLDYDAPVAAYWPEFAAAGKADVTVRDVLAHRAGLSAPDSDLTFEDILDWSTVTQHLARQAPLWPPGEGHAYHALTHGWLVGEIIRRCAGVSVGKWFAQEIARPLDVPCWIGLPPNEGEHVAHLQVAPVLEAFWNEAIARVAPPARNWPLRAMTMGQALPPTLATDTGGFNDPRLRAAQVPGAGGIATADALATIWSACVTPTDGVVLLSPATVRTATEVQTDGAPVFDPQEPYARWGMGFQLDSPARRFLTATSFGHVGAGGQMAFADPARRIGFAFLTNWMEAAEDPRADDIVDALRRVLPNRTY